MASRSAVCGTRVPGSSGSIDAAKATPASRASPSVSDATGRSTSSGKHSAARAVGRPPGTGGGALAVHQEGASPS